MNGLDFFFSPSSTVDASTGNTAEDDDWGDFVDSSPRIDSLSPNPYGFLTDQNGANSIHNRIEPEKKKKNQAQWVNSRGPVPLSVFGEEEEEEDDESGATVSSFNLSFDSFSSKPNGVTGSVNRVVNSNPNVEISGLIANLYRENGQTNGLTLPENNSPKSLSSRKIENSAVRSENLSWNPLSLDTERSENTNNAVNSSNIGVTLDSDSRFAEENDDDGWEFKTAESTFGSKDEQEKAKTGSVTVQDGLSTSVWSSHTNGTGPSFDSGKVDEVKSSFDRENGDDDDDLWGNGGWEFKVAEAGEPKKELANKESNGWGFGFGFEPVTTNSFQSKFEIEPQKKENGSVSFPSNGNLSSKETSWAFNEPSLETRNEKEEKEVQTEKPKGVLPLSFFEDEELETSDTLGHEDNNPVSVCDFSVREKAKAPNPTVSINDLISSLYSQVDEKNAVNRSEKSDVNEFVTVKAAPKSSLVNGEDDLWEFQGPTLASENSDVTEAVENEFDDDSWEFQGPEDSTSSKGKNVLWEYKRSSVENEVWNQSSVPNGLGESLEKPVIISIELDDYKDVFHKLKTELYYIALNHLETLKEARDLAADSDEVAEVQKRDGEIQDLENLLNNDGLISEVNVKSLQPRSSGGTTELSKALQEPKFRAIDSEDLLSERLLSAEKDWKSTIELLKHATLTLKILNSASHEQQAKYVSTWFVIASACAQELRHAASIWKQVVKNNVQEEILSKPQGKKYVLSVGEVYRVVKILRASTRLYKPWILLATRSSNVLAVLDECVNLWLSSGLEEALRNNFNRFQELDGDCYINEVDVFTCITSASSPTCYISGLNSDIVSGIKMVEWNGDHYMVPLANLWANLVSREPPSLLGHRF